jgi:hypothetical protein
MWRDSMERIAAALPTPLLAMSPPWLPSCAFDMSMPGMVSLSEVLCCFELCAGAAARAPSNMNVGIQMQRITFTSL